LSGLHANLSGLTPEQAFMRGDLNGDLVNDFDDFVIFRRVYDLVHGSGAFSAQLASVPEAPRSTMIAFGISGIVLCGTRTCSLAQFRNCVGQGCSI
jgi:hypothetical protein